MIASHFLAASLKTPTVRSGFSTDSASPSSRADRRFQTVTPPSSFPAPLTRVLPDAESTLLLGLAALTVPALVYGLLQSLHLMSGGVLENAIRAFVP